MRLHFDDNGVLHLCPENNTEAMALKYWAKEFSTHGTRMIEIDQPKEKPGEYREMR